jgi:hypothetical protein
MKPTIQVIADFFSKGLSTNNMNILHLIFGPSLAAAQSQNP